MTTVEPVEDGNIDDMPSLVTMYDEDDDENDTEDIPPLYDDDDDESVSDDTDSIHGINEGSDTSASTVLAIPVTKDSFDEDFAILDCASGTHICKSPLHAMNTQPCRIGNITGIEGDGSPGTKYHKSCELVDPAFGRSQHPFTRHSQR